MNKNLKSIFPENKNVITDKNGKPVQVPHDGSIALLALGYRGLMEWRKRRAEFYLAGMSSEKSDDERE